MKTFVTGASDFVGRSLVAALRAEGHEVSALTREPVAAWGDDPGVHATVGDLSNEALIERAAAGCEVAFHCDAATDRHADRKALDAANVVATENLLAALRRARVRRLVHLSTADVTLCSEARTYIDEDFVVPGEALSDLIETRVLAEDLVVAASDSALETVTLRAAWIWGADDAPTETWLRRELSDGTFRWIDRGLSLCATTHVRNLAAAMLCAARAPGAEAAGGVFYVTDDERTTAREFLSRLAARRALRLPRISVPFALAYAAAWVGDRLSAGARYRVAAVASLGRNAHFNVQRARKVLEYAPVIGLAEALAPLGD